MNVELYINKQLCDIENPKNLSITLKRQFLNPAELNTKDAQKSYNITLPATATNNYILGFKNTEEVRGKFVTIYDAYLVIGGVKIFDGKFRLSEIGKSYYSGNLGVPAQKSIKDIFGDRNMNEAGEWKIDFVEFSESIQKYNNTPNSECIFPYVMYGLIPKRIGQGGNYTAKNTWDDTVALTIDDFPPSINCLQAIRKIFENERLNISGTAFNDERLTKLYMSYKNPLDYQMPWNYGTLGKIKLYADWSNYKNLNTGASIDIERTTTVNSSPKVGNTSAVYATDLLSSINGIVISTEDNGRNIVESEVKDFDRTYKNRSIVIPYSGLYKIVLSANIKLNTSGNVNKRWIYNGFGKELLLLSPVFSSGQDLYISSFADRRHEIKVIRDNGEGDFNFDTLDIDREFYKENIDQDNNFDKNNPENFPKYFPNNGELCYIDPTQSKNIVCGLSFGKNYDKPNPFVDYIKPSKETMYSNTIALKGGLSWNTEETDFIASAANNKGYQECYLDDDNNIAYRQSDKFKVDLRNSLIANMAITNETWTEGGGTIAQVVWLEKGERITVVACSDLDRNIYTTRHGVSMQDIHIDLSVEAFQSQEEWITDKLDRDGSTKTEEFLDWNDPTDFEVEKLNLIKFLPSDIKIDNWLENFTKAFNLTLAQVGPTTFELNVKQSRRTYSKNVIDLDSKANVNRDRKNSSLNLPSVYDIGFTASEDERGYIETGDNGGGKFYTGNTEGNPLTQMSSFSYNWFKPIYFKKYSKDIDLPIISENEPFEALDDKRDYAEMMQKDYSNLAQRFWYKGDNLLVSGYGDTDIEITLVKNDYNNVINLNYHNVPFSILSNFFTIFVNNDTSYTTVECYLSPEEYNRLSYSLVQFNNDLYYPAEIDGYDPLNRRKATLKLIRKLL